MKKAKCSGEGNIGILENQLYESHLEIEWLIAEIPHIKSPDALHAAEKKIGEATNRLAARILALKIQESLNKPEIQEDQGRVIKAISKILKNQKRKEVNVATSYGKTIVIVASYFSQEGKKDHRKKRGKEYIQACFYWVYMIASRRNSLRKSALQP